MDIKSAASYMNQGYRIRLPDWLPGEYLYSCCGIIERNEAELHAGNFSYSLGDWVPRLFQLLSDDWELITEGIIADFPLTYGK